MYIISQRYIYEFGRNRKIVLCIVEDKGENGWWLRMRSFFSESAWWPERRPPFFEAGAEGRRMEILRDVIM